MKNYILGIDGGGTKTHCAFLDMKAGRFDLLECGTTNHENMPGSYEELRIKLYKMLDEILARNNAVAADLHRCVFGMGGVDTKRQHEIISGIIRDYGINDFHLCNDAFLGIKAGCRNGYGICAINGSGFSTAGIDPAGRMLQIGGQGSLTGDKGGGYFLVSAAIRSVYGYLFKGLDRTLMSDMLFSEFQIDSKYDFMDIATEKLQSDNKEYSRKISKILYEAANSGDRVALDILEEVGGEYAKCIGSILRELDFGGQGHIEIILAGSQFVKGENPRAVERIKEVLNIATPGVRLEFKLLEYPCVAGALIWAGEGIFDREILCKTVVDKLKT